MRPALRPALLPAVSPALLVCLLPLLACDGTVSGDAVDPGAVDAGELDPGPDGSVAEPDDCPRVRVTVMPGNSLNLRPAANTEGAPVASLPNNSVLTVLERVSGQTVENSNEWFHVTSALGEGYLSAAYATCTQDAAPELEPPDVFRLPLACGTTARVSQANNGSTSHSGRSRYAFDFAIPVGTPLVAMADGIVLYTFGDTGPGDPCYNGGGSSCFPFANYVVLVHGDGSASIYKHLNAVLVSEGEFVPAGTAVGLSGSTGYSTGPHAHVMRQEECGAPTSCQSVPVAFADVPGDGVPVQDQVVTSGNCQP